VAYDPFLSKERADALGVKHVELEELFSTAQVVSNHLANNKQTKGMLNRKLFEKLVPFATFLNTGRGAQVVEDDLVQVLQARPDLTAVLDVTYPEPPEADHPFYTLPNCFLTPHIAGSLGDEVVRMAEYMAEELAAYLAGTPTRYEVSEKMLETMA
jgi:phosphoglycerate dehydrogenase-like enzyme